MLDEQIFFFPKLFFSIRLMRGNLLFVSKGQTAGEIDYAALESLVAASNL